MSELEVHSVPLPNLQTLCSLETIRNRSRFIFQRVQEDLGFFKIQEEKWPQVVEWVDLTMLERYPEDIFPMHSRWRHFEVGEVKRVDALKENLKHLSSIDRIASLWDLAIISVLVDAGAGSSWSYLDEKTSEVYSRSEGLAIASLDMFLKGLFSGDKSNPYQVDAVGLSALTMDQFEKGMQISSTNVMVGAKDRFELLKALGTTLEKNSMNRPGNLIHTWKDTWNTQGIEIQDLFTKVLLTFNSLWPKKNIVVDGYNFYDVWKHPLLPTDQPYCGVIPFHKLTLWLVYSLIEPVIQEPNGKILNWTNLPGLPEYRNGGLFVDMKLIIPKDLKAYEPEYEVYDPFIVEWRALTIVLLDTLATKLQKVKNMSPQELPLASVLEGGSWSAGRKLAKQLRSLASPPFKIKLTGTVF